MKVSIFGFIEDLNIEGNCSYHELESLIDYINFYSEFNLNIVYYHNTIVIIKCKYNDYIEEITIILDKYTPWQFKVFIYLKAFLENIKKKINLKENEIIKLGQKTWKECGNEIIRFYGKLFISKEYNNMLIGLINQVECNKGDEITIDLSDGKMLLKLLRKLIFDELININDNYVSKEKVKSVILKYILQYEEEKEYRFTDDVEEEQEILRDIEKDILKEGE